MTFLAGLFLGAACGYLLCGWFTAGRVADMERLCALAYAAMQQRPDEPDPMESPLVPNEIIKERAREHIQRQAVERLLADCGYTRETQEDA
jgi:hypothetical protein